MARGLVLGELDKPLGLVLGFPPVALVFTTAWWCHFFNALEVCSSKIDLFMWDPI